MIITKALQYITKEEDAELKALFAENEKLALYDEQDNNTIEELKTEVDRSHQQGKPVPKERMQEIVSIFNDINKKYERNIAKTQDNMTRIEHIFATAEERYLVSFAKAPDIKTAIFNDIKEVAKALTKQDLTNVKEKGFTTWKDKPNNSKNFRAFAYSILRLQLNALTRYHLENETTKAEINAILQGVSQREYPRKTTRPSTLIDEELPNMFSMVDGPMNIMQDYLFTYPTIQGLQTKANRETKRNHQGKVSSVRQLERGGIVYLTEDNQGYFQAVMIRQSEKISKADLKLIESSKEAEKVKDFIFFELSKVPGLTENIADRGGVFTFPLDDFVKYNAYTNIKTARRAFKNASFPIINTAFTYDKIKSVDGIHSGAFSGAIINMDIEEKTNICTIDLNPRFAKEIQNKSNRTIFFISNVPEYYFMLSSLSMRLMKAILRHARTNRVKTEANNGQGTLTYKYLQEQLGLPEIDQTKDPANKIIAPLENALKEILSFEKMYHKEAPEINIFSIVDKGATIRTQLETGKINYVLSGATLRPIENLNHSRNVKYKQIEEAQE